MAGGLDLLIVGIAGKDLDFIAPDDRLRELFGEISGDDTTADQYLTDFHALVRDPTITNPRLFYLQGEHLRGAQIGAGLGYVIFDGNNNSQPRKLDERVYQRIDELKQIFIDEVRTNGLNVPEEQVGVYALNVDDI